MSEKKEGVKRKLLAKRWQSQENRAQNWSGKMERCKNKGAAKEAKNIEIAWRLIQDEVVDDIRKSSAIQVLGDGNQRSGY